MNPQSTFIQSATLEDAKDITLLLPQWNLPHVNTYADVRKQLEHLQTVNQGDVLIARVQDGTLVGYVQLSEHILLGAGVSVEVMALLVHDAYRGIGIGKALLSQAEQWALQRNIFQMILSSQVHRIDAHRLYAKVGYHHYKHSYYFLKKLTQSV